MAGSVKVSRSNSNASTSSSSSKKSKSSKKSDSDSKKPSAAQKFNTLLEKALPESVQDFKDREDRDPQNLNDDVQINFSDIIAEPSGYHSSKYVWHMAMEIYIWGKDVFYQLLSFLFGIPLSLIWGCLFAVVACLHVWCYSPWRRSHIIKMNCWQQFWSVIIKACFDPFFESAGKVYSNINVKTEKIIV